MGLPHRIAIVGAGLIGSALAGHLIIGARRPDAFTRTASEGAELRRAVTTLIGLTARRRVTERKVFR
jgi:hypothetical protein